MLNECFKYKTFYPFGSTCFYEQRHTKLLIDVCSQTTAEQIYKNEQKQQDVVLTGFNPPFKMSFSPPVLLICQHYLRICGYVSDASDV